MSLSILITFLQGNVIMGYIIINHFWEFKGWAAPPPPPMMLTLYQLTFSSQFLHPCSLKINQDLTLTSSWYRHAEGIPQQL